MKKTFNKIISYVALSLLLLSGQDSQAKGKLRVAFVGDPQVDSEQELQYARKSIFAELRSRTDLDMVIILGDLVNDKTQYLEGCVQSLDSLRCSWICVPGNHDRDMYKMSLSNVPGYHRLGRPRDLDTFQGIVGPADTTFTLAGVKFICLNDVMTVETNDYKGALSTEQKIKLERELASTSIGSPVVICTHIPLEECEGGLLQMIRRYDNVLLVSGHTHRVTRTKDNLIAGATCGSWWRGVKDAQGIPYALQICGAPRGYFVADFEAAKAPKDKQWYSLRFKTVGSNGELSVTKQDKTLVVNVFGGSDEGKVSLKVKGMKGWVEAPKASRPAPECEAVIEWNSSHDKTYRKEHKEEFIPMLRRDSPHVWSLDLPLGVDPTSVKVRYNDPAMKIKTDALVK